MSRQQHYLQLAAKVAKTSTHHTHKIGAVVVNRGRVVGMGANHLKTHPKSNHPFKSIHAELKAILNSGTDAQRATLYLYRETKRGETALAKPCTWCQELIAQSGITRIVFTNTLGVCVEKVDRRLGTCSVRNSDQNAISTGRIENSHASAEFRANCGYFSKSTSLGNYNKR